MTALAQTVPEPAGGAMSAVGVVVPARDEQARIGACLISIRHALDALPDDVAVAVAVVLDRCTDATPERVAAALADWPQAVTVTVGATEHVDRRTDVPVLSRRALGSGVGALRDLGAREVLGRLAAHPPAATWLLSTDADSIVPVDWAIAQLWFAHAGAHAVAGLADLAGAEHLAPDALRRYRAIIERGLHGDTHGHVYGANLGVRADAYLAVGGFPPDGAGEDHGLWRRLGAAGYTLAQPVQVRVQTSARLHGRADDGLAHLLRSLHRTEGHRAASPRHSGHRGGAPQQGEPSRGGA